MGEPMFPHGMRWADIFCPGSRPSDYSWGHLPDANGRCQRCDYSQPADLRERLSQGNGPVVVTIPRHERKTVARQVKISGSARRLRSSGGRAET